MSDSGEGPEDPPPQPSVKATRIRRRAQRLVYDPTFVPMPQSNETDDTCIMVGGQSSGTTGDGEGETVGELYEEGTYNEVVEDIVDRHGRFVIRPDGNGFLPNVKAASCVSAVIREKWQKPWLTWGNMTEDGKDQEYLNAFFRKFRTLCTWRRVHTPAIKKSFVERGSHRLCDMLGKSRRAGKCPKWLGDNVWNELVLEWGKEEYQKKCAQAKANRASERGSSVHRGGNISYGERRVRMSRELNRPATVSDVHRQVNMDPITGKYNSLQAETFQKKHDAIMRDYMVAQNGLPIEFQETEVERSQFATNAWVEVVGGKHRGRVTGAGSLSYSLRKDHSGTYVDYSIASSSSSSSSTTQSQMSNVESMRRLYRSQEEEMAEKLKKVEDEMAEYKRSVEQQREEERKENDARFQRLESLIQSRAMPPPAPMYYNPPPQYDLQSQYLSHTPHHPQHHAQNHPQHHAPHLHSYYNPNITQPRNLPNYMLQPPQNNSNISLSQAYLQDLNRPPMTTVPLPNVVLTSQPDSNISPNLIEAMQDYNNSLGPDLDYALDNNNDPTNNGVNEYYDRDQD